MAIFKSVLNMVEIQNPAHTLHGIPLDLLVSDEWYTISLLPCSGRAIKAEFECGEMEEVVGWALQFCVTKELGYETRVVGLTIVDGFTDIVAVDDMNNPDSSFKNYSN